ncbi:squalene synthetase-like protein [Orobanche gracilis]
MGSLRAIWRHPGDLYPMVKLKLAARIAERQIPAELHWGFCYSMLHKVSRSFALVIQQLDTDLRDAVCIFYLVLRALDTVEDDTSIATDVKVPILMAFHQHIYDREWHFSLRFLPINLYSLELLYELQPQCFIQLSPLASNITIYLSYELLLLVKLNRSAFSALQHNQCGTKDYKVLMDEFHHVSSAFLELGRGYQEAIEDITMRMGAGMAKFICKEVETVGDYDEYCHYVAGLVGLGLSKLFHASGKEELLSDTLSNSMGLFLQKTNIIRDYLEDINEIPKSRMFWPRQIWSKYVNKLEDLKYEENSVKAVQCLNDMVTNALVHVEDCLKYMSSLHDPAIFRFCAIPQIMAIGTLALCYNNIDIFRGVVKLRRGLTAKIIDKTKTIADVYGAFYDFSRMLKSKVIVVKEARLMCIEKRADRLLSLQAGDLSQTRALVRLGAPFCCPLVASSARLVIMQLTSLRRTPRLALRASGDGSPNRLDVDDDDPNARKTKDNLEVILKICTDSGNLNQRNSYIIQSKPQYNATLIAVLFIILAILLAYLSSTRPSIMFRLLLCGRL